MIHPATTVRSAGSMGVGVFATEDLPKGTLLWVLDRFDRVLDPSEVATWPPALRAEAQHYGYINPYGSLVVCWDHGRLVNHSCDPTSIGIGNAFEIARRDVRRGDELTCDYGILNLSEALQCACGLPACRGQISADAAPGLLAMWQAWAVDAFAAALRVPQLLLPYAKCTGDDVAIHAALRDRRHIELPAMHMLAPQVSR